MSSADEGGGGGSEEDLCADVVCNPSNACHAAGTCDPTTGICSNLDLPNTAQTGPCFDGVQNGSEAGVDCGGEDCIACPTGSTVWSKRFGASAPEAVTAATVDAAGNAFVLGIYFVSGAAIDFGTGPLEGDLAPKGFLVKLDGAGTAQWSKSLGLVGSSFISEAVTDVTGNLLVGGKLQGDTASIDFGGGALASSGGVDAVVAKLSPGGVHLWSRRFGEGGDQTLDAIATDLQGDVLLAGTFWDHIDLGGGPLTSAGGSDIFVARFDASGQHVWSRSYGGTGDDRTTVLVTDAACGLILAGVGSFELGSTVNGPFAARLDSSGEPIWSRALPAAGPVTADAAGHVFAAWNVRLDPLPRPPMWSDFWPPYRIETHLERLDPSGEEVLWDQVVYSEDGWRNAYPQRIAVDSAGNAVVALRLENLQASSYAEIEFHKTSATGHADWSRSQPGRLVSEFLPSRIGIGFDPEGAVLIAGSTGSFATDVLVAKYAP